MPAPAEYLAIRAWCEVMGMDESAILVEQMNASRRGVPTDSLYYSASLDMWIPLSTVHHGLRRTFEDRIRQLKETHHAVPSHS